MAKKNKYTKSKAIYTIKNLHSKTNGGNVYEHDHITIVKDDGIFDENMTLFSNSNFKYKVRTEDGGKRKHSNNGWLLNGTGETWTLNDIGDGSVSEETSIIPKPNYSSLRDFAYYGSAVELVKATVRDIIMRFPGGIRYYGSNAPTVKVGSQTYKYVSNEFEIDCWTKGDVSEELIDNPMRVLACSYKNYVTSNNSELTASNFSASITGSCRGTIIGSCNLANNNLLLYLDNDGKIRLVTSASSSGWIIKPKDEIVKKFWAEMDDFERVLLNRDSSPIYTAIFETPYFTEDGYYYVNRTYTWPTVNDDGFTPDLTSIRFKVYLDSLLSLAQFHDEYDSDNIWRMMTHEAIKNLDWTHTSYAGFDSDEVTDIETTRQSAILRMYGRLFDDIKRSADGIKANNSISYDEKNNVPDYFLSDVTDLNGWESKNIIDFKSSGVVGNIIYSGTGASSTIYTSGKTDGYINSLFQRRLALSSNYIHSLKGTRRGLETILGMFGYTPSSSITTGDVGQYYIGEYVVEATGNISGNWPLYCSAATLRSSFEYAYEGDYEDLMWGYPVARTSTSAGTEYLIPWYNRDESYGNKNFYFQGKGGWGKMKNKEIHLPISITKTSAITADAFSIYKESTPYMFFVSDIEAMTSLPNDKLFNGAVCYVEDISNIDTEYKSNSSGNGIYSHYFILENVNLSFYAGLISNTENCYGWKNIDKGLFSGTTVSNEGLNVVYLESIIPMTQGNNPHNGFGQYDDGQSYFCRFDQLFYDAIQDNKLDSLDDNIKNKITNFGFNLDKKVNNKKCFYFGNCLNSGGTEEGFTSTVNFNNPELGSSDRSEAAACSVMNSKYLTLKFFTGNNLELKKYIKDTVLKYVEEMIPATAVVEYLFDSETSMFNLTSAKSVNYGSSGNTGGSDSGSGDGNVGGSEDNNDTDNSTPSNNIVISVADAIDPINGTTFYGEDEGFYNNFEN